MFRFILPWVIVSSSVQVLICIIIMYVDKSIIVLSSVVLGLLCWVALLCSAVITSAFYSVTFLV